jgi:hypothetical protein
MNLIKETFGDTEVEELYRAGNLWRREVNRGKIEITLVDGASELVRSERGAEATAEARS